MTGIVSKSKHSWIRNGKLKKEIESVQKEAKNNSRTNYVEIKKDNTQKNIKYMS